MFTTIAKRTVIIINGLSIIVEKEDALSNSNKISHVLFKDMRYPHME